MGGVRSRAHEKLSVLARGGQLVLHQAKTGCFGVLALTKKRVRNLVYWVLARANLHLIILTNVFDSYRLRCLNQPTGPLP